MRVLFSVVGLLVVLAIVMLTARQQLRAVAPIADPGAAAPSSTGESEAANPPPARTLPKQVQQDVQRALEQGAAARASVAEQ